MPAEPDAFFIRDALTWLWWKTDLHDPIERELVDTILSAVQLPVNAGLIGGPHRRDLELWLVSQRTAVEYFRRLT